jgi:branched-chain amino acid aminotransferase
VINVCKTNKVAVFERNFTLADVYAADEAFITGTFAGLTPVSEVDGRKIGVGSHSITKQLEQYYVELIAQDHQKNMYSGV